jgi:hypothetical protein
MSSNASDTGGGSGCAKGNRQQEHRLQRRERAAKPQAEDQQRTGDGNSKRAREATREKVLFAQGIKRRSKPELN